MESNAHAPDQATIAIDPQVLQRFPGLKLAVVVVENFPQDRNPGEWDDDLRRSEAATRTILSTETLTSHPVIREWREAYRSFGLPPGTYRSSVEALLRRILSGKTLPSIHPAVDLYNLISIQHLLPVGAFDLERVEGPIRLVFAEGTERFVRLGAEEPESLQPGEVVYRDDTEVLCRGWNYRESSKSSIRPSTKQLAFVLEGLEATSHQSLQDAAEELCRGLEQRYQLTTRIEFLPFSKNGEILGQH